MLATIPLHGIILCAKDKGKSWLPGIKQGRTTAKRTAFRSMIVDGVLLQKTIAKSNTRWQIYGTNNFNLEVVAVGRKRQDK